MPVARLQITPLPPPRKETMKFQPCARGERQTGDRAIEE